MSDVKPPALSTNLFIVKSRFALICALSCFQGRAVAADNIQFRTTYNQAYGETKNSVTLDPAKDLPHYPAIEVKDALATWKVKSGFKLQLAAHEPQVRDPVAISFDENGRMFVSEMIDYSEMRDAQPHLGRISMLEDRDGDGVYETSTVFADNLPWPTGLIWANGGLFVCATPDIWRFEDRDGDGRAEIREKVFTGFGSGLDRLNVQSMMNSPMWGQDNRIHVQTGGGARGKVKSLKTPAPEIELGGRDFWFDPRTYEFGLEGGGAQFGMSFDNYGRKFGCSNSVHLQYWVYEDRYAQNPFFTLPAARQSIAADGGAAEVFRISPDEPWRIIRTRWRIGGVVRGAVEGGGRVSGYFTGATGTTVFRGDAYGEEFVNNTFTGDAGGQLVHRKIISPEGATLVGKRPADEQNFEFAASKDTWVRVVNFANAPDGCLYVCDMYREIVEHPWSIPEEIKQHLDLNNGNNRGRIYRIAPENAGWQRRSQVQLGRASTAELVKTLEHPNGWHRDTASRLLYERQDKAATPLLAKLGGDSKSPLARHHALGALDGLGGLNEEAVVRALSDTDEHVRERGLVVAEKVAAGSGLTARLGEKLAALVDDPSVRVRFQLAFTLQTMLGGAWPLDSGDKSSAKLAASAYARLATKDSGDEWVSAALLSGRPEIVAGVLFPAFTRDLPLAKKAEAFVARLIEIHAASKPAAGFASLIDFVAQGEPNSVWLRALGAGLRRAGTTIEQADSGRRLAAVFTRAAATAADAKRPAAARLEAIDLLGVAPPAQSLATLTACLAAGQPDAIQAAAIKTLAQQSAATVAPALLRAWPNFGSKAKETALATLISREDNALQLLQTIQSGAIKPDELPASQVQSLVQHRSPQVSSLAKTALAAVIPPSREQVVAKFQPSVATRGEAVKGLAQFQGRCMVCHRAGNQGVAVGPDMVTVKTKGREALLTAILEPHKEVAPQYIAYEVNTKDGQAYSGIIAQDEASSLSLQIMGGSVINLPRANIKGSSSSGRSLMPEGLESGMSVQDMADLLTFIEEL
ncbi:MAG: hypothetical protein RIQ93_2075 [Verrucomicrobiota bacterium]